MPEPLRIWAFTMTCWNTEQEATERGPTLQATMDRVEYYFRPERYFLACGTWSEPKWSPLPLRVPIVNSGVAYTKPYEARRWAYAACSLTAAMAYALNDGAWDLLVTLDTDVLVGNVDFDAILREFLARPEELVGSAWGGHMGMPLAWKRAGAARFLHQRKRANLVEDDEPDPLWIEEEFDVIYKGRWWNAWPAITTTRQDGDEKLNAEALKWPFLRAPHPSIINEYVKTQTVFAKPVQA